MFIRWSLVRGLFVGVMMGLAGPNLSAQQTDVIRGRVIGDDGKPVAELSVSATSIPNNVTRTTVTDRNGRYTITFTNGDGDYWVSFAKVGYTAKRFELKRLADEVVLVADARIDRNAELLDAVRVRADRARAARNGSASDPLGTEKAVTNAGIDPGQSGNLAALAASTPGVQLIPGAEGNPDQFSVFGLGGDQNRSTLNGIGFGGTDVPRDAATRASLGTTPWDVSRGGFSGAQMSIRTQSGSNFSSRAVSSLMNAPQLEWTDRQGRALGAEYASLSLGAATAGSVKMDKSFYSAGYQFDRRSSDLPTLANADPVALTLAGVATDSVSRLRNILGSAGVPLSVAGTPTSRMNERGLLLAAFDFAPPSSTSGQALNITAVGSLNRSNAPFAQVTGLSTNDVKSSTLFGAVQARHTNYVRGAVLSESMLGISQSRFSTEPYLQLPGGTVRVASTLEDGSSAITGLSFGGSRIQNTRNTSTTLSAEEQLSWFSLNNQHGIKFSADVRYENFGRDLTQNALGSFTYNSLADLSADQPVAFTRLLAPRRRTARQLVGGVSLGDTYKPRTNFQLQYGVRVDGNTYLSQPDLNSALRQEFGVDNSRLPSRLYVSPRLGFSWTYGEATQLAVGNGFVRGPRAVLRGGVGVFQNTPNAELIGAALSNTGLANATQQLVCVGAAAPKPDWASYATGGPIPDRCADGSSGTVFSSAVPEVALFDRDFRAQRSIRSTLNWSGTVLDGRLATTVDATYSRNRNQSGVFDLNFRPEVRFALSDEGARPVYVLPGSIVPATGAIAAPDARKSQGFSRVTQLRSNLESVTRQFMIGIQPVAFSSRYSWSAAYVYSNARDLAPGFGSTAFDPRVTERGRSSLDSRHQFNYGVSYNFFDWVPVSLRGALRSGRPFTPLVSSDVNGDGYVNDRAFVFPANGTTDALLRSGMAALLENGSASARACLTSQTGTVAGRNSCQSPWSSTSSLTIGFNAAKFRLPQRLNISLFVNNAFGAADLLLHGENKRRGWGQTVAPDQTLLFVRGFDNSARRFRYEVNPRFGATNQNQTLTRNPVVVTAQFRLDVGFTRERQLLTQSLDRGRVRPGNQPTDSELRGMGGALIPPNPMTLLLQQADSLKLTRTQADSLATLNRVYSMAFEETWTPVAELLAALPTNYDRKAAYQRYRKAREASIDALMKLVPDIRGLLTPTQLRQLPTQAATSLDRRYLASVRSSTAGGANMGALAMLAQMGWTGGTVDASATAVMLHR